MGLLSGIGMSIIAGVVGKKAAETFKEQKAVKEEERLEQDHILKYSLRGSAGSLHSSDGKTRYGADIASRFSSLWNGKRQIGKLKAVRRPLSAVAELNVILRDENLGNITTTRPFKNIYRLPYRGWTLEGAFLNPEYMIYDADRYPVARIKTRRNVPEQIDYAWAGDEELIVLFSIVPRMYDLYLKETAQ